MLPSFESRGPYHSVLGQTRQGDVWDLDEVAAHVDCALTGLLVSFSCPWLPARSRGSVAGVSRDRPAEREPLTRAHACVDERGQQREVTPLGVRRVQEDLALLLAHGQDALHALGLGRLVGPVAEGRVRTGAPG